MPAMLLRPWIERLLVAGAVAAIVPGTAMAGWPWSRPAPQPAIPVGPPIYAPSATPTVTNYQPAYQMPSNAVPAAVAPSLVGPPTTYTPAPAQGVIAAPTYAAPTYAAPTMIAPSAVPACGTAGCGVSRVTGYVPPTYGTSWQQAPTTTYRPVVSVDPATGLPINAVQPCTTTTWQARRVPNNWWGGLWPASNQPPTVVAYTPAMIAAYPQAKVTTYAPPPTTIVSRPVVTQYAPAAAPVVTQYAPPPAPVVRQYAPAPTVTQYAPAPAPTVTQYAPAPAPVVTQYAPAPAPTVTQYAPAPAPTSAPLTYAAPPATAPATQPCPHGCPNGHCQQATGTAPPAAYPQGNVPANAAPSLNAPQSAYPGTTIVPNTGNGREPASIAPRLDSGATIRQYAPTEYDNEPVVPVTPPSEPRVIERRAIETPRIQSPQLQSPGTNSSGMTAPPKTSPLVPFARPVEKPASTTVPERNLRLVPDPDAERLELRRDDIPNLIKPGDRTTQVAPPRNGVSVPVRWPNQPTVTMKPTQSPTVIPAAMPVRPLDDSGWRSVAQ